MMGRRAAKIAKVKGREDAKRGKAFARIGKKIIMVSKQERSEASASGGKTPQLRCPGIFAFAMSLLLPQQFPICCGIIRQRYDH